MTFIAPDLPEMIARYQAFLQPEDPRFGEGISDWTITSEYDENPVSESNGEPIWGCMCSPSVLASEGRRVKLQPEDIAAKQAHIVVRRPQNRADLIEVERTAIHELGHVLHAKLNLPRDAEEEIMHSLDHFFSKLSPEQGAILARSFQNPMARAYRAENTAMPDPIEDPKKPDKPAPAMQEGADMSIDEIKKALAEARLAGDQAKVLELVDKLLVAHVSGGGADAITMPPPDPPTMGMKPEDAYARGKKEAETEATAKAVKAFARSIWDITDEQRAEIADAPSMERAERLLSTYPRQSQSATLGVFPGKAPGRTDEKPMARAMRAASENPMVRKVLGIGSLERDGVHLEPGNGILIYTDGTEQLNHQRAKYEARQDKLRGAA